MDLLLATASSVETYGGQGGSVASQAEQAGSLPFSGLDVAALVVIGLVVMLVGFVLARLASADVDG